MTTLDDLIGISRRRPREKRLVCPMCSGLVVLRDGRLWCAQMFMSDFPSSCEWVGDRLAELKVKT